MNGASPIVNSGLTNEKRRCYSRPTLQITDDQWFSDSDKSFALNHRGPRFTSYHRRLSFSNLINQVESELRLGCCGLR